MITSNMPCPRIFARAITVIALCWSVQSLNIISIDQPSCKVTTDEGKLDLSTISTVPPQFIVKGSGLGSATYYWNPCDPYINFGCPSDTELAAVSTESCKQLGSVSNSDFTVVGANLVLTYRTSGAAITLMCKQDAPDPGTFTAATGQFLQFTLTSKHACLVTPDPTEAPGGSTGLSVGSVLCIILLVLTVTYIVVGVLVMKYSRKAQGREVIPNITFWSDVPLLVKDGTIFVIRCSKRSGRPGPYESI